MEKKIERLKLILLSKDGFGMEFATHKRNNETSSAVIVHAIAGALKSRDLTTRHQIKEIATG